MVVVVVDADYDDDADADDDPNVYSHWIRKFFGIRDDFPHDQFLVRTEGTDYRTIYFVSVGVKELLADTVTTTNLQLVNTGTRCFGACSMFADSLACSYRLFLDGLDILRPYFSLDRQVNIELDDVRTCMDEEYPRLGTLSPSVQRRLEEIGVGGCFFVLDTTTAAVENSAIPAEVVLPVWIARISINVLLNRQDRQSLKTRLRITTPEDNHNNGSGDNEKVEIVGPETVAEPAVAALTLAATTTAVEEHQ